MATTYLLRVVDRGSPKGVPVVDAYLLLVDGGVEQCLLSTLCNRLAPPEVDAMAEGLAELGVAVEREVRHLPDAAAVQAAVNAKKQAGAAGNTKGKGKGKGKAKGGA